ncbi:MAG TPA: acido-empty-quinoprotein group A [Bryobacteraceae bacterium]|nr:acido-empty-quinoprotein group A [Bryobacteraceae bacterium]
MKWIRAVAPALLMAALLAAQGLTSEKILHPTPDIWPTYNGDYSGRRFSKLDKINTSNIQSLSLAWVYRINSGGDRVGGAIKSTPLLVNGVLYFTIPDHVWAVDARTGKEVWQFTWQRSRGGIHLGNRGVGIYGNWLYFETPDCNLVSLNIKDGTERWHKQVCDLDRLYYASVAPIVIGNHVLVGVSGDDLDIPGYLDSRDPETGDLQWRWYTVPQKQGDPGLNTWPSLDAAKHGGGMTWVPSTYDPDLNLVYVGTGNPQPVIAGKAREGDNLFTESIVALHLDTGKMAWYFQCSPHDTHDWDAVQTPILIDGEIDGKPRKLVAQASRNGYFFVLDRVTGKNIVTSQFVKTNWAKGVKPNGEPIPDPAKMPQIDGALVSPNQGGAVNWPPSSFDPQTGLFYVNATRAYSEYYIFDTDEKPEGWGGNDRGGWAESMLQALDYKTGKICWSHKWEGAGIRSGVLSTAGGLVFAGDPVNNLVALNAKTGDPLWHANLGEAMSNGPMTYELDGAQYLVAGAGDTLYGFVMNATEPRQ